jgi:putative heme-binding domain-containing protein
MTQPNRIVLFFLLGSFLSTFSCTTRIDDSQYSGALFSENIRTTEARTPAEEQAGFRVPPGFEIQLFASEPDIDKPINMTFDARGRLWVTQSFEYPFPKAPGKKGTDKLTILEDTDHDGKADRFTKVDDTLNIPIGILPYTGGAVAFSVPDIYRFSGSDETGKFSKSEFVLGPFGYQDTHGMVSNFVRGYDGWVYACHGFTNRSNVAGRDGDSIRMVSGDTFRFRLDGSRVEQMTFGQVNPFGLVYDEYGYLYSTDSHSSPLYQLIRGGDYPHFGKVEIMAFAPDMKPLVDEATALCGIAYYGDTKYPQEFQRNFFIGDVVNSRVHRYSWNFNGSSPVGKSEIDFIKSADPWFRPVNIKMGPDGALYVADFYNAIIGHYEVPLGHPKRDKQRGRIWRIAYKGDGNTVTDLAKAQTEALVMALDADNLTTRMAAADQLVDRVGTAATPAIVGLLRNSSSSPRQYAQALWVLYRLGYMHQEFILGALGSTSPLVRVHALRVLREWKPGDAQFFQQAVTATRDTDPHVQRAAIELLMSYPDLHSVKTVLGVLNGAPTTDTHLVYTGRLCLRNLLRHAQLMHQVEALEWNDRDASFIAGVLVDVPLPDAALFLNSYLGHAPVAREKTQLTYQQMIRFIPEAQLQNAITSASRTKAPDIELEAMKLKGIQEGLAAREGKLQVLHLDSWATEIAVGLLTKYPSTFSPVSEESIGQQRFACLLVGDYRIKQAEPNVLKFLQAPAISPDVRAAALKTLLKLGNSDAVPIVRGLLETDSVKLESKKRLVAALGEFPSPATNELLSGIRRASPALEIAVVTALAGSEQGRDIIFRGVRAGSFMSRTLADPRVAERMMLNISKKQQREYDNLIANVAPVSGERQVLIEQRVKAFKMFKPSSVQLDSGQVVFGTYCGVCHRKTVQSGIGPQLNGVGKRGAEAIAEKILDPNRNISEAFRNYTVRLKDGKVVNGLFRREQGAVIVFGDLTGKEFSIAKKDIAEQKASRYTIMPDTFGSTLSQHEFDLLLTYLLNW